MNGLGGWQVRAFTKYASIPQASETFVFIEEADPRSYNEGTWVMYIAPPGWVDGFAIFHGVVTTFAFADGHVARTNGWKIPPSKQPRPLLGATRPRSSGPQATLTQIGIYIGFTTTTETLTGGPGKSGSASQRSPGVSPSRPPGVFLLRTERRTATLGRYHRRTTRLARWMNCAL